MVGNLETVNVRVQRTRRNVVKMGAIGASAVVATFATSRSKLVAQLAVPSVVVRPHCFLRGTTILTADGARKIEDLAIGDWLPTVFGGTRPIRWIGRYPFRKSDPSNPWPKDVRPVRVARSALAVDVPHADLYVTAEHAFLVDGLLIPVGNLINGTTITRRDARDCDELEYFNIKVEGHDVIYAEGAPVETLRQVDKSAVNFAEYFRTYGGPESQESRCAPWVSYGGARGELKSRLRSAISPWLDRREAIDAIRDRLEERGLMLSRQLEPIG